MGKELDFEYYFHKWGMPTLEEFKDSIEGKNLWEFPLETDGQFYLSIFKRKDKTFIGELRDFLKLLNLRKSIEAFIKSEGPGSFEGCKNDLDNSVEEIKADGPFIRAYGSDCFKECYRNLIIMSIDYLEREEISKKIRFMDKPKVFST